MATTKRIQFRGISRTPSDRMTADGGCAESLNVYLDNDEIAPVIRPDTIDIGIPEETTYDRIFIHKTTYAEIYVVADSTKIGYYKDKEYDAITTLIDESINDITSVGNTLIVATTKGMKYALFKDGRYEYLGDRIPYPSVEFQSYGLYHTKLNNYTTSVDIFNTGIDGELFPLDGLRGFNEEKWGQAIADAKAEKPNDATAELAAIQKELWSAISSYVFEMRKDGVFAFPFLARVAVPSGVPVSWDSRRMRSTVL